MTLPLCVFYGTTIDGRQANNQPATKKILSISYTSVYDYPQAYCSRGDKAETAVRLRRATSTQDGLVLIVL